MPYYGYGGYGYYGWDPTFIILVPAILFTIYAQFKVSSTTSCKKNISIKWII